MRNANYYPVKVVINKTIKHSTGAPAYYPRFSTYNLVHVRKNNKAITGDLDGRNKLYPAPPEALRLREVNPPRVLCVCGGGMQ